MRLTVAICIATHNRREELSRSLAQITRLEPLAEEILVVADGCKDGTATWLRSAYPAVRLLVHDSPRGSIASRNEMARATECDIMISLDDDSYPLEEYFVASIRQIFAQQPRLAVLSFPQRSDEDPASLDASSFGSNQRLGTFENSAAALRRSAFLEIGGYPDIFFHAYEEPDFALRCVAAGWEVRRETSLTVRHHFTSLQRDERRTHQRHARNELWSVLLRCPAMLIPGVMAFRIARQFGYAWRRGWRWVVVEPVWWIAFLRGAPRCWAERQPLPLRSYLSWMKLVRRPVALTSAVTPAADSLP